MQVVQLRIWESKSSMECKVGITPCRILMFFLCRSRKKIKITQRVIHKLSSIDTRTRYPVYMSCPEDSQDVRCTHNLQIATHLIYDVQVDPFAKSGWNLWYFSPCKWVIRLSFIRVRKIIMALIDPQYLYIMMMEGWGKCRWRQKASGGRRQIAVVGLL